MRECERCQRCYGVADGPSLYHSGKDQRIPLCKNCYHFMMLLFDDVIDEYVLRKE